MEGEEYYFIGKVKIRSKNLIHIGSFLNKEKMPKKIILTVKVGHEIIEILDADKFPFGAGQALDKKGRVTLPNWLIEELKGHEELFVMAKKDGGLFLSVKTGSIL